MASVKPAPYPLLYLTEIQNVWNGLIQRQAQIRKPLNDNDQNSWSIQELRRIVSQISPAAAATTTKAELIQAILQQASRSRNYFVDDGCGRFVYNDSQLSPAYRAVLERPLRDIDSKVQGGNIPLEGRCNRNEAELFDRWKTRVLANRIRENSPLPGSPLMVGVYYPAAQVQDIPELSASLSAKACEDWKRQSLPQLLAGARHEGRQEVLADLANARLAGRQEALAESFATLDQERKRDRLALEQDRALLQRDRKQLEDEKQKAAEETRLALNVPIARYERCQNELKQFRDREEQVTSAYARFSAVDAERRRLLAENDRLQRQSIQDQRQITQDKKAALDSSKHLRAENDRLARTINLTQADARQIQQCQKENQTLKAQIATLQKCQSDRLRLQNDSDEYKRGQTECSSELQTATSLLSENKDRVTTLQNQLTISNESNHLLQTQLQRSSAQQQEMDAELKLLRSATTTSPPVRVNPPVTRSRTSSTTAQFAQVERAYEELQRRTDTLADANSQLEQKLRQTISQRDTVESDLNATITDLRLQVDAERRRVLSPVDQKGTISLDQYNALETQYEDAKVRLQRQEQFNVQLRNTLGQLGPGLKSLFQEVKDYYSSSGPQSENKPERIEQIESILTNNTKNDNELSADFIDLIIGQ